MMKPKILHIDDDAQYLRDIKYLLHEDYDFISAENITSGMEMLSQNPHLVLLDVEFDNQMIGADLVRKIKTVDPDIPIIMVSKHEEYKLVVKAINNGASNYYVKSSDVNDLKLTIDKTLKTSGLIEEVSLLKGELKKIKGNLIGSSKAMVDLREKINNAAKIDNPILIFGETGTGKELVANAIHEAGKRKANPFFGLNVSALNEELFASELFGHEKGAFTGAHQRKKGLFEVTSNGTLFLDEIGYLSLNSQVKLLRTLEEKEIRRVGGNDIISVNTRVISATNRDLSKLMSEEKFREDLYYRISAMTIELPPLRSRKVDIPELAKIFLAMLNKAEDVISDDAYSAMMDYDWPGNIRELRNVVEISSSIMQGNVISADQIKRYFHNNISQKVDDLIFPDKYFSKDYKASKEEILKKFKKEYIKEILKKTNGNISEAARISGLNRTSFYTE